MPGSNMSDGLDAGPNQTRCGAGSVLGPDFGEILTSLVPGPDLGGKFPCLLPPPLTHTRPHFPFDY